MQHGLSLILAVAAVTASLASLLRPPVISAQGVPNPPELGAPILEDALTATGALRATSCATGRNNAEFVPGGFRMKVTGRCTATAPNASHRILIRGLTVRDGEASVEAVAAEGSDRVRISLFARQQTNGDGYSLSWEPSLGVAALRKAAGDTATLLAERTGLAPGEPGASTRLSLRISGDTLWGFVDDELLLTATDTAFTDGGVALAVGRRGNPDDDAPTTVVWRNLRVAGLAEGDLDRAPTYEPPAVTTRPPSFVPPAGTPPVVGPVVMDDSLAAGGAFPTFACPTGHGGGELADGGYVLRVRGRCIDTLPTAMVAPPVSGLTIADGEMSVDFRVAAGAERSTIAVTARVQGAPNSLPTGGYAFGVFPAQGVAVIMKWQAAQGVVVLAQRRDVGGLVRADEWNTLSARLLGSSLWLFVNGQPVLAAEDGTFGAGRAGIEVDRLGNPDDEDEVAVMLRDLRVSAIEGAPDDRAPTYERPRPAPVQATNGDRPALGFSRWRYLAQYP